MFNWLKKLFVKPKLDLEKHKRENPLKNAVYRLGSADPVSLESLVSTFSGVDIKVRIDKDHFCGAQSIEFKKGADGRCTGKIVEIIFDNEKPGHLVGKTCRLTAIGANGYGKLWRYFDETVKFTSFKTAVSIDDIAVDGQYEFEVVEQEDEA